MKKIVSIYFAILIGVYLFLSALNINGDYAIEKKLWHINKQFVQIQNDPSVIPDKNFENVANKYRNIIESNPDSQVIEGVYFLLGQLYEMKEDYAQARKEYQAILEKYPDHQELVVNALFQIGKSYEIQGNESESIKTYESIIEKYPLTTVGLSTPIYIANYYKSKNNYDNTMDAYQRAITFYQSIASSHPDSVYEFTSLRFLANCYLEQNRWTEAVKTLDDVLMKYSEKNRITKNQMEMIVKTINAVSAYKIQDYQTAIDVYERFMQKYPDHPYNEYLEKVIEVFNEAADGKGLQASTQK